MWIQTDSGLNGGQYLVDTDTRKPPVITEADALRVELGAFASGLPKDLGDFNSLTLCIFESRFSIDGTPLVTESVPAVDVTDLISLASWNNRLASNATWEITAPSLTFELGSDTSRKLFMAIYGVTAASETLLGASEIAVIANQDPLRAGIGFQSAWALATSYGKKDLARNDGTVYISKIRHTSDAASEPGTGEGWEDFWELFVERGATGAKGDKGDTGNTGGTGPTGPTGPGFTYREAWGSGVTYAVNDVVSVLGAGLNAYVCKQAHTSDSGSQPESGGSWTTYWFENPILQAVQITGYLYNATLPTPASNQTNLIRITNSDSDPSGNTPGFNNAVAMSDGTKWRYVTNGLTVNGA